MKSEKDEGKGMDPLFPRLHISDADKGGPKPPPRNKMALCDQYNSHSETPKFNFGSTPIRPTKNRASFAPQVSSINVGSPHQQILPTFRSLPPRPSHLTEGYHPYYSTGVNLNVPQTNCETRTSDPIEYQKSCRDENDFQKPCYVDKKIILPRDTEVDDENPTRVSLVEDKISSHKAWMNPLAGNEISALNSVDHHKKRMFMDERLRFNERYVDAIPDVTSGIITRKRCASLMDNSLHSFSELGDKNEQTNVKKIEGCSKDQIFGEKKQKISDSLEDYNVPCPEVTPNDVVGVIGQKFFWKARNIIMHQQRMFAMQIFELHRLIKVQKLIAGSSSEVLRQNNFNLNEPSIKFPPIEKLLYVTPLDPSPVVTKTKPETLKPDPGEAHGSVANNVPLPKTGPVSNAKTTPMPTPTPTPWCFNQWLIPVKSPSEGLIYKPYTGPCPPAVGVMGPVFGNCGPIGLNSTAYGVPAPKSYFQSYPMPLINASHPINEADQTISFHEPGVLDKTPFALRRRDSTNGLSQQDSSGSSPPERLQGDELSLFPTKPSFEGLNVQRNEQKVQVIKVVPHNRKSAPESAARIFRSIQEERNRI